MNKSGVRPIEYNCIVEIDAVEEKTAGGLYMPEAVKEREKYASIRGTLVAKSGLAFTRTPDGEPWPDADVPKVGDRVVIAQYAGATIADTNFRILKDQDITGIEE